MITKSQHARVRRPSLGNIGKLLLAIYLIATGIFLLTGLNILILIGVLALFAGVAI